MQSMLTQHSLPSAVYYTGLRQGLVGKHVLERRTKWFLYMPCKCCCFIPSLYNILAGDNERVLHPSAPGNSVALAPLLWDIEPQVSKSHMSEKSCLSTETRKK